MRHTERPFEQEIGPRTLRLLAGLMMGLSVLLAAPDRSLRAQAQALVYEQDRAGGQVTVPLGQSLAINTQVLIERIAVGNPNVADIVPLSEASFNVTGIRVGRTNVTLYGPGGKVAGVLNVEVSPDVSDLERTLRHAVPGANVRVGTANGRLHLSGTVPDAISLQRVLDIADQYGSEKVINALRVNSPQQVMLEVRLIEASRNSGKELGISWFGSSGNTTVFTGNSNSNGLSPNTSNLTSTNSPFGTVLSQVLAFGVNADVLVQALESKGLARRLAEPNLVALSGEKASFLAGGEVPIPIPQGDGQITIEYKEFGVRLEFTPTVLDDGLINLLLEPEVSTIDDSVLVEVGDLVVPAFNSRRVRTTVELRSGQSFAIAGLLQSNNITNQEQIPWLGNIPVLGTLFSSRSFQKDQTDLVVIVTPHLAQPARPGTSLSSPLDGTRSSNEIELFLLGKAEVKKKDLIGFAEGKGVIGSFGHFLDLQ